MRKLWAYLKEVTLILGCVAGLGWLGVTLFAGATTGELSQLGESWKGDPAEFIKIYIVLAVGFLVTLAALVILVFSFGGTWKSDVATTSRFRQRESLRAPVVASRDPYAPNER